ncbi:hypothetical protein [Haloparvum sp. PAK95]|uniref:hypothetical protein n=1 Tax=Haloparvum sp. PAK95 TaxID=3418962 RepID=UPI003D2ECAC5
MSLDELSADVEDTYSDLGDEVEVELPREARTELAMLAAAFGTDPEELVRRGIHALFRQSVDTGDLDFQLRSAYDVTYDEYLSDMTYDEMTGSSPPPRDDERRYQM